MSQLYHGQLSTISSTNSSTTPLDADGVYTGKWEDISAWPDIIVSVSTDVDGSYSVQYSPDGTNIDSTLTRYYQTNQINPPHRFTNTRKYFRVVYTNNGTAQSYFRLQVTYGHRHPLNAPIDGTLSQDYDATAVRPTDYHYEVGLGLRQGHRTFNKFGYNLDVDTGEEVVSAFGGTYTPPTTATTLTIVSSDTADDGDPAGTGAQRIQITGLDANRKTQTETVTLNGTTNVVTTSTWLGINRAAVALAGSAQENVGTITVTATTGGAVLAQIPAREGTTQQCIYHTQLQSSALADWLWVNVNKIAPGTTPTVTMRGQVYNPTSNSKYEVFRANIDTAVENTISVTPSQPFMLSPGDVFWLTAQSDTINTIVTARFSLIEVQQAAYDADS